MKKTQKEFIQDISNTNKELNQQIVKNVLEAINKTLKQYVKDENDVTIHGLGAFSVKTYEERQHFNPATKQVETIKPSKKLTFKPSKKLYEE